MRTRAELADVLDQVRTLETRLQAALKQLDGEAAAPVPDRHAGGSDEDLPPAATSVEPVETDADVLAPQRTPAAELSRGIKEGVTADDTISTKFTWD
jgi:hypothetical protein